MGWKPGGGGHYQIYDDDNGQYTDELKSSMNEKDMKSLKYLKDTGYVIVGKEPHFPLKGVHNNDYAKTFIEIYKCRIHDPVVEIGKVNYLLTYSKESDKSNFLINIVGLYNKNSGLTLQKDLIRCTDFKSIKFDNFNAWNVLIYKALTTFDNGYEATTFWAINPDLTARLITLIPKRDEYDK